MLHRAWFLFACAVCLSWTSTPRPVSAQQPVQLEQVDAGIEDTGTLRTSQRVHIHDLRQPVGFERVYQLRDGTQRYVRINGAIQAAFPRSTYAQGGSIPTVPPGTVYHIGSPQRWSHALDSNPALSPARISSRISNRASGRIDSRARDHAITPSTSSSWAPAQTASPQPTVWSDERYRQARIAALLLGNTPRQ